MKQGTWSEEDEITYKQKSLSGTVCVWKLDEPEYNQWIGECGGSWWFDGDNPTESGMIYCPHCGKPLVQE